ncbi:unnamed protein product [Moneuplotes crassus]|uniref:Uncharacterized protein n=1 Tax=Euplotes crassus TaxID=5936 RepID=A0AAD1XWB8_EUPCR|nr:unnamed protein product [Moneuplotes crassus]
MKMSTYPPYLFSSLNDFENYKSQNNLVKMCKQKTTPLKIGLIIKISSLNLRVIPKLAQRRTDIAIMKKRPKPLPPRKS